MQSKARFLGHPIHPMLVPFPIGLLATSLIFDIICLSTGAAKWAEIARWLIAAGLIGGVLALIPGLIDFIAIPAKTRAKAIGLLHAAGNATVMALFFTSWMLRTSASYDAGIAPVILSALGVCLMLVTGWLGGELVDRLGVGVDDGANLNAPSSLRSS
jgi:uncharacterized membrane protein